MYHEASLKFFFNCCSELLTTLYCFVQKTLGGKLFLHDEIEPCLNHLARAGNYTWVPSGLYSHVTKGRVQVTSPESKSLRPSLSHESQRSSPSHLYLPRYHETAPETFSVLERVPYTKFTWHPVYKLYETGLRNFKCLLWKCLYFLTPEIDFSDM